MHVNELEIVLHNGQTADGRPRPRTLPQQRDLVEDMVVLNSLANRRGLSAGPLETLARLRTGAGWRANRTIYSTFSAGSEGTLAGIISAELKVVPLPGGTRRGPAVLFVRGRGDAGHRSELLDLKPAAIEHIDRPLFDQTRGQREFQAVRDLLELDTRPCEAILIVEFFEDVPERLALLEKRKLGLRRRILETPDEADLVWAMRKAGLSLLTSCKGDAKPVAFIEDAAVRPRDLPEYVNSLQKLMRRVRRAGFVLRPRGGGIAARAADAGFASRGGFEKIPADCRRSGRAREAIQGILVRRTRRGHGAHRVSPGSGRRGDLPAHAANQADL